MIIKISFRFTFKNNHNIISNHNVDYSTGYLAIRVHVQLVNFMISNI